MARGVTAGLQPFSTLMDHSLEDEFDPTHFSIFHLFSFSHQHFFCSNISMGKMDRGITMRRFTTFLEDDLFFLITFFCIYEHFYYIFQNTSNKPILPSPLLWYPLTRLSLDCTVFALTHFKFPPCAQSRCEQMSRADEQSKRSASIDIWDSRRPLRARFIRSPSRSHARQQTWVFDFWLFSLLGATLLMLW